MEALGTPMGGGALKLEATQLRRMQVPILSEAQRAGLDAAGREPGRAQLSRLPPADEIVMGALCAGMAEGPSLADLAKTLERRASTLAAARRRSGRVTADTAPTIETIRRCRTLREAGRTESVLREEFVSRLRGIFRSAVDERWINRYTAGSESLTRVGKVGGDTTHRFIDNLVGSTTIEYEADLRVPAKCAEGLRQVREHVAGLIRQGIPVSQVRGILSDTVEWQVVDARLAEGVVSSRCTDDDIELKEVETLDLAVADEAHAERLTRFLRKHLAREQSRQLEADALALDLGLKSSRCRRNAERLERLVRDRRDSHPSVDLATDLWSTFVDHLASGAGDFRADAYADEVYLLVLARLLSANVLARRALLSDDDELRAILDGSHFTKRYRITNMVEADYFGWLTQPDHIDALADIAREIQRDLYAYDFGRGADVDLFGRLMTQLAGRSQRKLLGQEPTPAWLAKLLAERCLDGLPTGEAPRIVDMCCGSGTMLVEILKTAKSRRGLSGIESLREAATGFDIDPLAVAIAKTTWVTALSEEIKAADGEISIPIYHADSLFSVTPVSAELPLLDEAGEIRVTLGGEDILLPADLVRPDCQALFDRMIDWAYDEAIDAEHKGVAAHVSIEDAAAVVDRSADETGTALSAAFRAELVPAARSLVNRMIELSAAGRNGVWAFILRNTYRPGLLTGRFNGIVSNPPWLTLSGIADNPYRNVLTRRARVYGIRPTGPSFLHLELGTTHLLHAVDRYLQPGGAVACVVPGTVFNGHHHEPLRQRKFLSSERSVALEIAEAWQVAPGTFNYPGAAIIGHKRAGTAGIASLPKGGIASPDRFNETDLSELALGPGRTAWELVKAGKVIGGGGMSPLPQQGADLMPRTAVCVEIEASKSTELRVETPRKGTRWGFTVKASKSLKGQVFPGRVAGRFVWTVAQSENLLPFVLWRHRAPVAIPAERDNNGAWRVRSVSEIRRMGLVQTARRFRNINETLRGEGKGASLQERIDERGKLVRQVFPGKGYLLLCGAGGKHVCAACIPIAEAADLVIDQTLYWRVVRDPDEAWFYVGMLNSGAMSQAIEPFNPKGAFGERHVHTLPYRLMPVFDPSNDDHASIAALAQEAARLARDEIQGDLYLDDPGKQLPMRRANLRERLAGMEAVRKLEALCALALGTATASGEAEEPDCSE